MRPGRPAVRRRLGGAPAQALRELPNPGFPRPSEEEAGLRRGRCLRGARTLLREPIGERDVSLARSLAAGAYSGGRRRRSCAASWRARTAAPVDRGAILSAFPSAEPSPQAQMLFNSVVRQPQLGVLRSGE